MRHDEKDGQLLVNEEEDKDLGWGLWLKASPGNGRTQYSAEEALALKGKLKQLFVSKVSLTSSSSNAKRIVHVEQNYSKIGNVGEDDDGENEVCGDSGGQKDTRVMKGVHKSVRGRIGE